MTIFTKECKIIILFFVIIFVIGFFILKNNIDENKSLKYQLRESKKQIIHINNIAKTDTFFDEEYNILIDEYNFEQFDKVKNLLLKNKAKGFNFNNVEKFNEKYGNIIKPIRNCYFIISTNYVDNYDNKLGYVFGFQLESKKYKEKYGEDYFSYPKYDLPVRYYCDGGYCDADFNFDAFSATISYPCKD